MHLKMLSANCDPLLSGPQWVNGCMPSDEWQYLRLMVDQSPMATHKLAHSTCPNGCPYLSHTIKWLLSQTGAGMLKIYGIVWEQFLYFRINMLEYTQTSILMPQLSVNFWLLHGTAMHHWSWLLLILIISFWLWHQPVSGSRSPGTLLNA